MTDTLSDEESKDFYRDIYRKIREILDRDLSLIDKPRRTVDMWLQLFGDNEEYRETKELLSVMNNLAESKEGNSSEEEFAK
ncbi:MAG: hypothetical protein NE327_04205 [Lentisphaeraceae bacterium]|nr:hypothetical protein [Lentisphaeraceae bacterium]